MAKTKYPIPTVRLTAGELKVSIFPRERDEWRGTAAQLTDAGVMPDGFLWPAHTDSVHFSRGGLTCTLHREPQPASRRQKAIDSWLLVRRPNSPYEDRRTDRQKGLDALAELLWVVTPEGLLFYERKKLAVGDWQFQKFKRLRLGIV